ncbi:MAG TPA: TonB-dependent receptor plug domain-containing protein, partial [Saprospiraceae bacterium]|nr:TonB-dependent receptor plug domain-containing protein [Saprospiraceae bacterium]
MKMFTNLKLVLSMLCLVTASVYGQFTAKGVVIDNAGDPLIGASVVVQGTTIGVTTEIDGSFSLAVPENEVVLEISFIGYETQRLSVNSASGMLTITLEDATTQLNEVVVVGYGTSRKEELTGAVSKLQSAKLEQVPLASVEQTLQGNVAGLQAVMGNGQPGANVQVRIRGIGSISASSEPLYVIDGIPVTAGDITRTNTTANTMAALNPNDIESVTVLKDAAATSIYGSRGANGVILITTKSGRTGKPKIDLRTQFGFNNWAVSEKKRLKGLTSEQYTQMFLEGWMNRGETIEKAVSRFEGYYPGAV